MILPLGPSIAPRSLLKRHLQCRFAALSTAALMSEAGRVDDSDKENGIFVVETFDNRRITIDANEKRWEDVIYLAMGDDGKLVMCKLETPPKRRGAPRVNVVDKKPEWKGGYYIYFRPASLTLQVFTAFSKAT